MEKKVTPPPRDPSFSHDGESGPPIPRDFSTPSPTGSFPGISSEADVRGEIARLLAEAQRRANQEGSFMTQIASDADIAGGPAMVYHEEDGASSHRCRDFPHMHHPMSTHGHHHHHQHHHHHHHGKDKHHKEGKGHKGKGHGHKQAKEESYSPSLTPWDESPPKDDTNGILISIGPDKVEIPPTAAAAKEGGEKKQPDADLEAGGGDAVGTARPMAVAMVTVDETSTDLDTRPAGPKEGQPVVPSDVHPGMADVPPRSAEAEPSPLTARGDDLAETRSEGEGDQPLAYSTPYPEGQLRPQEVSQRDRIGSLDLPKKGEVKQEPEQEDQTVPKITVEQPTPTHTAADKMADFFIGSEESEVDLEGLSEKARFKSLLSQEETPTKSPRVDITVRKPSMPAVTFQLGADDHQEELPEERLEVVVDSEPTDHHKDSEHGESKAPAKKKWRTKRVPSEKDLAARRKPGSEVHLSRMDRRAAELTEAEEARMLSGVDLDDMASHRLGQMRSRHSRPRMHKHSAMASIVHLTQSEDDKAVPVVAKGPKKIIDHSPHEMFVELEELHLGENREWQWHETARWIKFEEDVEEGADRWGKPHVASLSFHSLLELRRCIEQGAILLDLEAPDFPSVVASITDELAFMEQIKITEKGAVMKALLVKHRHVTETKDLLRRNLSYLNLQVFDSARRGSLRGNLRRGASTPFFRKNSSLSHVSSQPTMTGMGTTGSNTTPTTPVPNTKDPNKSNHLKLEIDAHLDSVAAPLTSSEHAPMLVKQARKTPSEADIIQPHGRRRSLQLVKLAARKRAASVPATADGTLTFRPDTDTTSEVKEPTRGVLRRIPEGAEATSVLVGSVDFLDVPAMAFVRLSEGRNLGNLTEVPLPVRFLFVLLGPSKGSMDYHEIGRSISTLMANTRFHDVAYKAEGRQDLLDAINEFLDDSMVLPPGDWDRKTLLPVLDMAKKARLRKQKEKERKEKEKQSQQMAALGAPVKEPRDPLKRTKRLFGGFICDIKERYPLYKSDILDGLNLQCLAAFFFIYFACLSPAITFGGLLGEKTQQWMGVSEMLVITSMCGVIMALFSGQPLNILGATGPVVLFEEGLYQVCGLMGVEFLPMRFWVGIWVTLLAVVVVMFELSFLVRYVTRFTEEIFAFLISLIFIYEVFKKLYNIFQKHPLVEYYPPPPLPVTAANISEANGTTWSVIPTMVTGTMGYFSTTVKTNKKEMVNQPNTALLSVILTFGCFLIAYFLKKFRNSQFFGRTARRALGDFGVPIAIVTMVLIDFFIKDTYTEKLNVPDGLQPTNTGKRGWFINPLGLERPFPVGYIFAAIIPAFLIFILLFMETQITAVIINKKERKLKKGTGYHLDMFLIGCFATISGIMGLPYLCSATVRSVTHVSALSVFSKTHAPGDKPKLLEVKEQRLTALCVHIMIGVSVLMGPVLRQVPLAVLFGVFLYMGIASLSGIQLVDRIELFFKPLKHYPEVGYVRRVRTWRMHVYTFIQLACLAVLWAIKSTAAALSFPFVLILLVPLRAFGLPRIFTTKELHELDKAEEDEEEIEDEEDEPDFYQQAHMPF